MPPVFCSCAIVHTVQQTKLWQTKSQKCLKIYVTTNVAVAKTGRGDGIRAHHNQFLFAALTPSTPLLNVAKSAKKAHGLRHGEAPQEEDPVCLGFVSLGCNFASLCGCLLWWGFKSIFNSSLIFLCGPFYICIASFKLSAHFVCLLGVCVCDWSLFVVVLHLTEVVFCLCFCKCFSMNITPRCPELVTLFPTVLLKSRGSELLLCRCLGMYCRIFVLVFGEVKKKNAELQEPKHINR